MTAKNNDNNTCTIVHRDGSEPFHNQIKGISVLIVWQKQVATKTQDPDVKHVFTESAMVLFFAGSAVVHSDFTFVLVPPQEMISIPGKHMKERLLMYLIHKHNQLKSDQSNIGFILHAGKTFYVVTIVVVK